MLRFAFDTGTADANPGTGNLRLNNADQSAATFVYVSRTDAFGSDATSGLLAIDDSDSDIRSTLEVQDIDDPSKRLVFEVTGDVVQVVGYCKIPVVVVSEQGGADPLDLAASLEVEWALTGQVGTAQGLQGDPGSQIFSASGAPDDGDGADGDFYLDTVTGEYYLKAAGTWGTVVGDLTGPTGATGAAGAAGAAGATGATGPQGPAVGALTWQFSTATAVTDPGAGRIRLGNADQNLADRLIVDDVDFDGNDAQVFLRTWNLVDGDPIRGVVWLHRAADTSAGHLFRVTNVIEQAGFFEVAIESLAEFGVSDPLQNDDEVLVAFAYGGIQGEQGVQGEPAPGSLPYVFSTTNTMADPTTGKVRFDNASPASTTALAVSDTDGAGLDRDALLDGLSGLFLTCWQTANPSIFSRFLVTAQTDNGTWHQLTVVPIVSAGSLTNADPVTLVLDPKPTPGLTFHRVLVADTNGLPTNNAALTSGRLVRADANGELTTTSQSALTFHRVLVADTNGLPTNNAALTASRLVSADANGELTTTNQSALTFHRVLVVDTNGLPANNAALAASRVLHTDANSELSTTNQAALTFHRVLVADTNGLPANNAALSASKVVSVDANGELTTATQGGLVAALDAGGFQITSIPDVPSASASAIGRQQGFAGNSASISIADDAVALFSNIISGCMALVTVQPFSGDNRGAQGILVHQSGIGVSPIAGGADWATIAASDTAPAAGGAGGTDAKLNFQADASGTTPRLWVKNRLGATILIRIFFLSPNYPTAQITAT